MAGEPQSTFPPITFWTRTEIQGVTKWLSEYFDDWSAQSQTIIFLIEHAWIMKNNDSAGTWPVIKKSFLGTPCVYEKIKQRVAKQRHRCKLAVYLLLAKDTAFLLLNYSIQNCLFDFDHIKYRIAILSLTAIFNSFCFNTTEWLIYMGCYASSELSHLHITIFIFPNESKMIPVEAFQFARGVVIMSFPIFRPGFPPHWISPELHFISHLFHPWPLYAMG